MSSLLVSNGKRFFGNENRNSNSNRNSPTSTSTSTSPTTTTTTGVGIDLHQSDSSSSLDSMPILSMSAEDLGEPTVRAGSTMKSSSGSGGRTRTRTILATNSYNALSNNQSSPTGTGTGAGSSSTNADITSFLQDHSWCAGTSRRRGSRTFSGSTSTNSTSERRSKGHQEDEEEGNYVKRHHSGGGGIHTPVRSFSGARQRTFSNASTTSSASTIPTSPTPRHHTPQRHLSGESTSSSIYHNNINNAHYDTQNSPPSTSTSLCNSPYNTNHHHTTHLDTSHSLHSHSNHRVPYGMLNPGSSFRNRNNNKKRHYLLHPLKWIDTLCSWCSRRLFLILPLQLQHGNKQQKMVALLGLGTMAILGLAVYQHDAMLQEALAIKEQEVAHHIIHSKELEKRLQTLQSQTLILEDKLLDQQSNNKEHDDAKLLPDMETQRRLFHLEHANIKMQQDVQATSRRLVKEKFGHGPKFYVQMMLEFDPQSNVYINHHHDDKQQQPGGQTTTTKKKRHGPDADTIILETASIDYMPHSVYLFLEQVDHGLYDGTAFHRNAAHLVQAGPSFHWEHPHHHQNSFSKFRHAPSLNSVIFQEYAPEMPHKQYTLGYIGRPGGPDFYVNMRDNSALHGPGGQLHRTSDIVSDADPCFAKIVSGYEAIERVHRSAVLTAAADEEGEEHGLFFPNDAMVHPVIIAHMKVLPPGYVLPESDSSDD